MKLSSYLKSQPRGALTSLAAAIDSNKSDVSNWASLKRVVPIHRAAQIEKATSGKVTRREQIGRAHV